jgi:hypothetical protein
MGRVRATVSSAHLPGGAALSSFRCCSTLLGIVALAGCAVTDHFDDRVARYDLAAAQSRDGMILTNIVRASHGEPLSFVQLGQLSGTSASGGTLGLPSIFSGPASAANAAAVKDIIFGASPAGGSGFVGNSANVSGSTSFQATPSETKDFYRGLLQEVEPRTLALFIQQGVARELLFYLFTDKIIEERGGLTRELRNDPLDPDFGAFQNYVKLAMEYGLSSELLSGAAAETDVGKKKPERWRLCFNRLYRTAGAPPAGDQPICSAGGSGGDGRTVSFIGREGSRVRLQILPRSAFGIFQYLGRIVAAGDRGRIQLVSPEAIDLPPLSDEYLFVVERGASQNCFLGTTYEGESYCVPRDGATNTKRILGLLTQLIALNTTVNDIPVTPTVRVVP